MLVAEQIGKLVGEAGALAEECGHTSRTTQLIPEVLDPFLHWGEYRGQFADTLFANLGHLRAPQMT